MGLLKRSTARTRALRSAASVLALLAMAAPADAARKPIAGKLSKPGFTVIALAANDKAKAVRAGRGRFKLSPPAGTVTLHLRAANGIYAGPIVIGRRHKGRRAIVGVRAGATLGRVSVRRGYAKVVRRVPKRWVDKKRVARARKGVPIGAKVFGRVRSRHARGPRSDRDLDGIPDPFDIDDDGDRIIDNLDGSSAPRAAQAEGEVFTTHFVLGLGLEQTANVNAGSTDEQIAAALPRFGRLDLQILSGDSAELDCGQPQSRTAPALGGLVYCTNGGTGKVAPTPPGPLVPFPDCCDPDGDGFGTLTPQTLGDVIARARFLFPGATAAEIGTGDVLIQRVTAGGVERQFPTTLQYVFASVPALVSYSDGEGNSATVAYPVPGPQFNPQGGAPIPGGPGTRENPFPVRSRANGNVVVTVTFWRPQRRPIAAETGDWIDIGGLEYTAGVADRGLNCQQSAFSEKDPSLTSPIPETLVGGGFRDLAPDRPASTANTVTYTLDLTQCLASPVTSTPTGPRPAPGLSFNPTETRGFKFSAVSPNGGNGGEAEQSIFFRRQ